MIEIRKAKPEDAQGIVRVCSDGYRSTYPELLPRDAIEKIIKDFYHVDRVQNETLHTDRAWNGWYVAAEDGNIIGAGGGGMTGEETGELFVLYLDPARKREGIGSKLLQAITREQLESGAKEQWVSVAQGNAAAIAFYEAVGFQYAGQRPTYGLAEADGFVSLRYKRSIAEKNG